HPTDLALNADGSAFYVVNEGEEAVARFTLDLGIVLPIEPGRPGTDFLPLTESALATVAIPLTSAAEPAAALTETGEPTLAIGTLLASAASEIRGDEVQNAVAWPLDEENAANMHMAPNPAEDLPGFVIGLEEAFERNGRELRQGLFHPRREALPMEQLDALFRQATGTWLPAAAERITRIGQPLADTLLNVLKPAGTILSETLQS